MEIGTSKDSGDRVKKNFWSLKEGNNVYRILPAMGELAQKGQWAVYYAIHWGYKNHEGKLRVFASPEQISRETKQVTVPDAAHDRIKAAQTARDAAKASGDTKTFEAVSEFLESYNLDKKNYVNAMNLAGEIGVLKIPYRAKQALDAEIKKLKDKGVDPRSVENGRCFNFHRTGTGRDTLYSVTVFKEERDFGGVKAEVDKVHVLTPEILARLDTEAGALNKLYVTPTADQVRQIVEADKAKDYTKIDSILGIKARGGQDNDSSGDGSEDDVDMAKPAAQAASAQASQSAVVGAVINTQPKTTAASTQPTHNVSATQPASTPAGSQSAGDREKFLASLGL